MLRVKILYFLILVVKFGKFCELHNKESADDNSKLFFIDLKTRLTDCGRVESLTRVINGEKIEIHRQPWIARLEIRYSDESYSLLCGGVLLTKKHVLTAAHCVERKDIINIRVGFGIDKCKNLNNAIYKDILTAYVHKDYSGSAIKNDIAIIKVIGSVKLNKYIKPIALPSYTTRSSYVNSKSIVLGWGRYHEDKYQISCHLRQAAIPIIDNRLCQQLYAIENYTIYETNICTLFDDNLPQDACQGDSGGPLLIKTRDRYEVIGIVSWGIGCADKNYPGVYTFVPAYLDWIHSHIRPDALC